MIVFCLHRPFIIDDYEDNREKRLGSPVISKQLFLKISDKTPVSFSCACHIFHQLSNVALLSLNIDKSTLLKGLADGLVGFPSGLLALLGNY